MGGPASGAEAQVGMVGIEDSFLIGDGRASRMRPNFTTPSVQSAYGHNPIPRSAVVNRPRISNMPTFANLPQKSAMRSKSAESRRENHSAVLPTLAIAGVVGLTILTIVVSHKMIKS